ncbi:MAG: flagellar basal body P-ring formation protein FlgA [Helicobacteraceae bacterium]|nr:flagellar basal body P-ring formation protein FlgA [Candidatus Sulfurimonas ponti]
MIIRYFLFLFISVQIFALTLGDSYYVDSKNIKLQDIFPQASYDITLYQIETNRYTKKIKSRELIELLKEHGFKDITASSRYVHFTQKSPIDTSKIKTEIIRFYKSKYPGIEIKSIILTPRGYIKELPQEFEVHLQKKAYLKNDGTLSIKTIDKKKLFFDYVLDAQLYIYTAKKKIQKGTRLSLINMSKKSVRLDRFKAMPINDTHLNTSQSKRKFKTDTVVTIRDIQTLNLVKRGSNVNVSFNDKNINISFSAKALQNGKLNDIITVQKSNKKRLSVKVVAKNKVEIQ